MAGWACSARNACCVHNHRHRPDCTSVSSQCPKSGPAQTIIVGSFCRTKKRRKTTNKTNKNKKQNHTKQQRQQQTNYHRQQYNKEKSSPFAVQGVEPFATGSTVERVSNGPRRPVKCVWCRVVQAERGQDDGSVDSVGPWTGAVLGVTCLWDLHCTLSSQST